MITTLMPPIEIEGRTLTLSALNRLGDALAPLFELQPFNAPCRMVHSRFNRCASLVRLLPRDLFSFSEFRLLWAVGVLR